MGVWIKYKNRVMEVTTFEIIRGYNKSYECDYVASGEGIIFNAVDGESIVIGYDSKEKTKMVFDKLTERIARLEILTRCIQGFDPEILNEDTEDEVTLKVLLDLMIFEVPKKDDPIFNEWEKEVKRAKMTKELKKAKAKSTNPVVNIDGRELAKTVNKSYKPITNYNKMAVKKNGKH